MTQNFDNFIFDPNAESDLFNESEWSNDLSFLNDLVIEDDLSTKSKSVKGSISGSNSDSDADSDADSNSDAISEFSFSSVDFENADFPFDRPHLQRKREKNVKLFGRKPRKGATLTNRNDTVYEHPRRDSPLSFILLPLLCYIGNGVQVFIGDSTLADAGKGLFLKKGIKKDGSVDAGTYLCPYDGVRIKDKRDIKKYIAKHPNNDYIWSGMNINGHWCAIDASDPKSCYGRYANDALSSRNNAEIILISGGASLRAVVRATKKIKKGEEIFIAYGAEYWLSEPERTNPRVLQNAKRYYKDSEVTPICESPIINSNSTSRKQPTRRCKQYEPVLLRQNVSEMIQTTISTPTIPEHTPVDTTSLLPPPPRIPIQKRSCEDLYKKQFLKKRAVLQAQIEVLEVEEEIRLFKLSNGGVTI